MKDNKSRTLMVCLQFLIFAWLSLVGYPRIFISSLKTYLDPVCTTFVYCAISLLFIILSSRNPILSRMKYGSVVKCLLILEGYMLLLFAQEHLFWTAMTFLLTIGIGVLLRYLMYRLNGLSAESPPGILKRCRQKVNALLCVAASILFLIPSIIGLVCEFDTVTPKEWSTFVQEYTDEALSSIPTEKDVLKAYPDVPQKIASWDALSKEEKTQLVQKIALMEQEYLGIQNLSETIVTVDKLDKFEHGRYVNETKTITIDVGHLTSAPVKKVIKTILHEVFHRYEYAVVEAIDFENNEINALRYFGDAKKWSDNMQSYVNGIIDYEVYKDQPLEYDAYQYSEERVNVYMEAAQKAADETQ